MLRLNSSLHQAAAKMTTRARAFELIAFERFKYNAFKIITEMMKLSREHHLVLVDEILHSIFFLGAINTPPYSPEDIMRHDEKLLKALKRCYPGPFRCCSTELPKRSPFSCVLDMVVLVTGQQKENEIINRLKEFIHERLHGNRLVSSTICVSQKNTAEDSVRYYGVSMSTSGPIPGQIIVAASCLSNWDDYVTDAVMTYYSAGKKQKKKQKKSSFDGTIRLPEQVRCQAFSLRDGASMSPCRSCGNMFGLTSKEQLWPYGNCAEVESLSNLLKNEKEMRKQVKQPSDTCTPANRQRAVKDVEKLLGEYLRMLKFQWDNNFYTPQGN